MTTAARPTFDPAKGKAPNELTFMTSAKDLPSHTKLKTRRPGQGTQEEYTIEDLKRELAEAEQAHFRAKRNSDEGGSLSEESKAQLEDAKTRYIEMAQRLDAVSEDDSSDDDDGGGGSESEDDEDSDDEDETAMLMRELEKIKRERAEEKAREEQDALEQRLLDGDSKTSFLGDNPLLSKRDFSVKRRWDDDVVFKNQAQGDDGKPKKRFVNDMLSDMDDLTGLSWSSKQQQTGNAIGGGSSGPRSGSLTPNYSPNMNSGVKSVSAANRSGSSLGNAASGVQKDAKDDPFGELVSFTSSSSAARSSSAKMTLRERQQILEGQSRSSSPFSMQQQVGARSLTPVAASGNSKSAVDTWNFDALEQADASRSASRTPVPQKPPTRLAAANALDFDPFAGFLSTPAVPAAAAPVGAQNIRAPNGNLGRPVYDGDTSSDDDPIPMDVGSPVVVRKEPFGDRDFEIAQVVEYGFSAEQAVAALEIAGSTRAAVQLLREQQATARQMSGQQPSHQRLRQQQQARTKPQTTYLDRPTGNGGKDSSDEDDGTGFYYDDPRRNKSSGRGSTAASQSSFAASAKVPGADKLLATANELGTNVWKQANSWFAIGKKKVMELQETVMDQRRPNSSQEAGRSLESEYLPSTQRYSDYDSSSSDDDRDAYMSSNRRGKQDVWQPEPRAADPRNRAPSPSTAQMSYSQSRLSPSGSSAPQTSASVKSSSIARASPARSSPASIPPVPDHLLQESTAAKTRANDQFKLGQFGDAITGYAQAISSVSRHSSTHPLLIVLYNNRALAYARNGEAKSASADCTLALDLCDQYQSNGVIELAAAGRVDVVDQRAKCLQRRAEAYEAGENYREGLGDWKALREVARDSGQRQQSTRGIQRCEKALGISQPASKSATPKPMAESKPEDIASVFASISLNAVKSGNSNILTMQTENSVAVAELRKKDQAKRDEEDQRFVLLDQVDAELKRWRDGKQQNIRALLSSLHMLLPEFTPIGMHEILEPNKVKRAYMRAIAKLHPDKLGQNIDLRTKMISSSVFSSLNEAWDAFKVQENIS
ncbi:auxilin-like clathrin-binding protein required for normal clathrin function [Coemansia sp. S155-1]|nr:auxilin-like clathrin-binding protein required for normal clathrin function [Coemansia sp. S155-1]